MAATAKYQALRPVFVDMAYKRAGEEFYSNGTPGDAWLPLNGEARSRKTGDMESERISDPRPSEDGIREAQQLADEQRAGLVHGGSGAMLPSGMTDAETILTAGNGDRLAPQPANEQSVTAAAPVSEMGDTDKPEGVTSSAPQSPQRDSDKVYIDERTNKDGSIWATKDGIMFELDERNVRDDMSLTSTGIEKFEAAKKLNG